ncbi:hypothetical protein [Nonomuraea endophytica]|uniref:hypothetical protein n=1 Tax=Nonomuraea endophytica TaxID=714136 RepID=UPI0037C6FCB2
MWRTLRSFRNRDGGFWVAATDPKAADQALTGSMPLDKVHAAALLSDGASRPVDRFAITTWRQTLDLLAEQGPQALLKQVRDVEHSDPEGTRWPCGKAYDDATAAYVLMVDTRPSYPTPVLGSASSRRNARSEAEHR